ncbi:hypothetical protein JOJ88_001282 [Pantoea cypripedii]|nr:hypothetical protein [Pantoea cypripedii]
MAGIEPNIVISAGMQNRSVPASEVAAGAAVAVEPGAVPALVAG